MGCGCGTDWTEDNPMLLGDGQGEPQQVKVYISLTGAKRGDTIWVQGSGAQPMIDAGWLRLV